MVEPMGLEPTTFSLQGNCAPTCATAPYVVTDSEDPHRLALLKGKEVTKYW